MAGTGLSTSDATVLGALAAVSGAPKSLAELRLATMTHARTRPTFDVRTTLADLEQRGLTERVTTGRRDRWAITEEGARRLACTAAKVRSMEARALRAIAPDAAQLRILRWVVRNAIGVPVASEVDLAELPGWQSGSATEAVKACEEAGWLRLLPGNPPTAEITPEGREALWPNRVPTVAQAVALQALLHGSHTTFHWGPRHDVALACGELGWARPREPVTETGSRRAAWEVTAPGLRAFERALDLYGDSLPPPPPREGEFRPTPEQACVLAELIRAGPDGETPPAIRASLGDAAPPGLRVVLLTLLRLGWATRQRAPNGKSVWAATPQGHDVLVRSQGEGS